MDKDKGLPKMGEITKIVVKPEHNHFTIAEKIKKALEKIPRSLEQDDVMFYIRKLWEENTNLSFLELIELINRGYEINPDFTDKELIEKIKSLL